MNQTGLIQGREAVEHSHGKYAGKLSAGFTLVELLMVIVIAGVLASMAAPSFENVMQETRLAARHNYLTGALRYARSEAAKRSSRITICARATASTCGTNAADWDKGWLIFVEDNDPANTNLVFDGDDVLLRIAESSSTVTIRANAIVRPSTMATQAAVQFNAQGLANWDIGTVVACDDRGAARSRAMVINGAGMLRKVRGDGTTAPADALGTAITCP